jgi:hypothetical protein
MAKLKITDSAVIKSGERELLDTIIGDLDWEAIEKIVKEKHQLRIQDDVEFRQGDIVVYDNTVAYKLDFDAKVTLTVLFDRDGNYLSFSTSGDFTRDAMVPDMVPDLEEVESEPDSEVEPSGTDKVIAAQDLDDDETFQEEPARAEDLPDPEDTQNSENEKETVSENTTDPDEDTVQEEALSFDEFAPPPSSDPKKSPDENMSGMVSQIAEMLSEINEENEE